VVRRLPMLWGTGEGFFPTLSAESLRIALGVSTLVVIAETDGPGAVEGVRIGDIFVPTAPGGELWLHFRPDDPALYVSARDILSDNYAAMAPRIEGQIVLIGASASGLYDRHVTPLGENVPGVSVHAQALEQMLSGTFLTRTDWVGGMELVAFAIAGVAMVLIVISLGPLAGLLGGAAIAAAIAGFAWYMFAAQGVLVDLTFPLLGSAAVYSTMVFLQFAITDADKRQIRRAFAHFVSPSLLTQIERSGDELKLGGEVRELSIMFADVREFTSLSERRSPEEMVTLLNVLFGAIGEEVVLRSGTIDKFVGDAMMAFWNAPVDVPDHPRLACEAALGMRTRLRTLNETGAFGTEAIRMGTGIATGDALVGNLGLESRFDYSCVGDTVNVASRIESACKELGYDIVLSGSTQRAAPELAALPAGSVILRGKRLRLETYILVGDQQMAMSEGFTQLRTAHDEAVRLLSLRADATAAIATCSALAAEVEPGLVRFYGQMTGRVRDFSGTTVAP
jgi:adenylate cyclase